MKHYRSSSKVNWKRGTSVSPNHPTHHHSSSSKKRMANYDRYKIIERSTPLRFEINILFPSSRTSSATSAMHTSIRNSMSAGDTTMYASAKETSPKQRSKPDTAFLN